MEVTSFKPSINAATLPVEKLAGNSQLSQEAKVGELSRQFEAVLLRQILTEAQKNSLGPKASDQSSSKEIYRDMITNQLAESISQSGAFGLARALAPQLSHEVSGAPGSTEADDDGNETASLPTGKAAKTL